MRRFHIVTIVACLLLAVATAGAGEIPDRPEKLEFAGLTYDVPDADGIRIELANGIPAYIKADRQLPLATVNIFFRGGEYLQPEGKEGLVSIADEVWRTGGAGELTAQELDEELDFLAAQLFTHIGEVTGNVRLNVLSKDLETGLGLLMDVLTRPSFQDDRFAKAKDDLIQIMKRRNDDSADIESREWDRLIFGADHWSNQLPTKATVDAITADDCKQFIASLIKAGNLFVAAAGDFDVDELKKMLDATLGALPALEQPLPEIPQPTHTPEPGVYVVNKTDVNQGRVSIGHIGYRLGHEDEFAMRLMNDILGGGGFTSRITKRVRSDEGLAYSAGSMMSFPVTVPGEYRAFFQSKFATCPGGIGIIFGLIEDVRSGGVLDDEIATSRGSFIEPFPRRFESAEQTATLFALDELLGRPHAYWQTYRDKVNAVTGEDIQKAAQKYLKADEMIVLIVGDLEELQKGHPDYESKLADFGALHTIPLRDPLTLEPLPEEPGE